MGRLMVLLKFGKFLFFRLYNFISLPLNLVILLPVQNLLLCNYSEFFILVIIFLIFTVSIDSFLYNFCLLVDNLCSRKSPKLGKNRGA